jgi:hypothetical protein
MPLIPEIHMDLLGIGVGLSTLGWQIPASMTSKKSYIFLAESIDTY